MRELPNFRHLYHFWTIAQEGSIKKASEKLNVSPSGMSTQLKEVESFFGKKLFERRVRRLELNEAGKMVADYCTTIFRQCDEMIESVRQARPRKRQHIRVGALPSLSSINVHEFSLPLWKERDISLSVIEGSLDELMYQLNNGGLEIVLSDRNVEPREKNVVSYRLKPQKIIAVGAEKFAWARKRFPRSLGAVPLMHLTGKSQLRVEVDRYLARHEIRPQSVGEADDIAFLRLGAERGLCVAILPQNSVQDSIQKKRLVKLGELKNVTSEMWALVRRDTSRLPIIKNTLYRFQNRG
ncbi:LysR family transcriptional regulator [Nitrospina gracilis]|uniref:LysR family transcriptional regulator n=1 Tax=Nitrospina gracilis TaxID=35801 RepID=UPI001F2AE0C1|nr:LysR family transcriptional regulator [Nitrospina gracilis]MCF8721659.1 LysR family transcriptional activator of nhaA [Nitrospina gracilis Nb-211]